MCLQATKAFQKLFFLCIFHLTCFTPSFAQTQTLPLELIKLPEGFRIDLFASDVPNARSLARGEKGTIFVGNRKGDKVFALVDVDGDYRADKRYIIAQGLRSPNGVAFYNGSLYVAEINRILRFDNIEQQLTNPPKPVVVVDTLPTAGWHGWKFIRFGPDNKLYVPVGAPCNVCEKADPYAAILRMNPDGSQLEVFARGIRNTVGFDWDARTNELWFTDNGRDNLGDDVPPDELNHAPTAGMHFGFPYCHGRDIADPKYGDEKSCRKFTPAAQELGAHVASLGMRFYTGDMFPQDYKNQIFIAEHGSWNRSRKSGYRVTLVRLKDGQPVSYEPFAQGWAIGEKAWGRPVDLLNLPDGSILVSDDFADVIYRISYKIP